MLVSKHPCGYCDQLPARTPLIPAVCSLIGPLTPRPPLQLFFVCKIYSYSKLFHTFARDSLKFVLITPGFCNVINIFPNLTFYITVPEGNYSKFH